jgi:uncharacterized protein YuzE
MMGRHSEGDEAGRLDLRIRRQVDRKSRME